jgi:hypothetical protein
MSNIGDRTHLASILGEIATYEHEQGRPLLPVVVVLKETGMPGQGFFSLARDLGLHTGTGSNDDMEFFVEEVKRVHKTWK